MLTAYQIQILEAAANPGSSAAPYVMDAVALEGLVRLGFLSRSSHDFCGGEVDICVLTEAGKAALEMLRPPLLT